MKKIVICCDGTWNSRDQKNKTNVVKISEAIPEHPNGGAQQLVYYDDGVGTKSLVDRLPGGVFGAGLWVNVQQAYRYLVANYEPGDEIFLFGFSRGAYTVRSVAGMVRKCGILRRDKVHKIEEAYDFYRDSKTKPDQPLAKQFRRENSIDSGLPNDEPDGLRPPQIKFLGVWDTVGSLGIPAGFIGNFVNRKHKFHDVALSRIVDNAFHALAIDEKRGPFRPTLWEQHPQATEQVMEQRWFAGVHTNVGGGNVDFRQSDRCLRWMMSKAKQCGLVFDAAYAERLANDLHGGIASSLFHEVAERAPFDMLTYLRPIGKGVPPAERTHPDSLSHELVDPAVIERNLPPHSYLPPNLKAYFDEDPNALANTSAASRDVGP